MHHPFFSSTLPCPPFHIPCSAFLPAPSPLFWWFFSLCAPWESTVIVSYLEALQAAAEPHQPSAAQRPVTWDLWLMFSVNNMDLLKESIEMPSEIRERAACLALGAFFMASSGIEPTGTWIWKPGKMASPCFPPVMFLPQLSLWPSNDGLQGKHEAADLLCSLIRYANASADISFEGKKKLKNLLLSPLLISQ